MAFSRHNSMRFDARSAIFTMVIAGVVVACFGSSVEAGVMLPWVGESPALAVDFTGDGCGASSVPDRPVTESPTPANRDGVPIGETLVAGFLGTGGGASAPINSSSGQTSLLLAAMFQLPVIVPLLTCLSRRLRERSLQLPQPPQGELLDPPKSGR